MKLRCRHKQITDETRAEIRRLGATGMEGVQIAKKLDVSPYTVCVTLKAAKEDTGFFDVDAWAREMAY